MPLPAGGGGAGGGGEAQAEGMDSQRGSGGWNGGCVCVCVCGRRGWERRRRGGWRAEGGEAESEERVTSETREGTGGR